MSSVPALVGVIHLPALPTSPRYGGDWPAVLEQSRADAVALAEAGFEAAVVENYGDVPFEPDRASPTTIACMTACAIAVRKAAPQLSLGVNVLRNDAAAALGVALAAGGDFVRVNVHSGARLTDQGIVQGKAHATLRLRQQMGAEHVQLLCDVAVKHSAPLAPQSLAEQTHDLVDRGLADAVLVTGSATGQAVEPADLTAVVEASRVPVLLASGVRHDELGLAISAHGVIVGSCLRADGRAGGPVDPARARAFVDAFRAARA